MTFPEFGIISNSFSSDLILHLHGSGEGGGGGAFLSWCSKHLFYILSAHQPKEINYMI